MLVFKFWKFFFTAYYVQLSWWGDKESPHENAFNLMCIIYYVNTISVINTIRFFVDDAYNKRLYLLVGTGIVIFIVLRRLIFNKRTGFKKRMHSFTNLSVKKVHKQNVINLVITLILTVIYQAVSLRALAFVGVLHSR